MSDRIIHLILIESNDPIGMEEIMKRVAGALTGDVIQLVPVSVPKPVLPSVIISPSVVVPPVRWVQLRNSADTVNVRSAPAVVLGNILGNIAGKDRYPLLSENNGSWYEISYKQKSGWVGKGYTVIV